MIKVLWASSALIQSCSGSAICLTRALDAKGRKEGTGPKVVLGNELLSLPKAG